MTQYFNVRIKFNNPHEDPTTTEYIQEQVGYVLEQPLVLVSVEEDVQARGMGEVMEPDMSGLPTHEGRDQ